MRYSSIWKEDKHGAGTQRNLLYETCCRPLSAGTSVFPVRRRRGGEKKVQAQAKAMAMGPGKDGEKYVKR